MLLKVKYYIKLNIPDNKIRVDTKTGEVDRTEGEVEVLIALPRYVNKYYFKGKTNEIHVINDVTLELPSTGMVAFFGKSGCGKTTLLNALLSTIPDNKRIFTIESGSRELSLVRYENGEVINNVVHTLSRPSENPSYDITQEDLVVAAFIIDFFSI